MADIYLEGASVQIPDKDGKLVTIGEVTGSPHFGTDSDGNLEIKCNVKLFAPLSIDAGGWVATKGTNA